MGNFEVSAIHHSRLLGRDEQWSPVAGPFWLFVTSCSGIDFWFRYSSLAELYFWHFVLRSHFRVITLSFLRPSVRLHQLLAGDGHWWFSTCRLLRYLSKHCNMWA